MLAQGQSSSAKKEEKLQQMLAQGLSSSKKKKPKNYQIHMKVLKRMKCC